MTILLAIAAAHAGYGDPVAGTPEADGRRIHLWTDAVRVDPAAFSADYLAGGCDFNNFTQDEQTPKAPLRHHDGLMEVAHIHNLDMVVTGILQHDSSDGTYWADRVWPYYAGWAIGENINVGYSDPRDAVTDGWMCSAFHRSSIMNGLYEDIGSAWFGAYGTQNFGGNLGGYVPPLRTAMHEDQGNTVDFYTSYGDGQVPGYVEVVLDGVAHAMSLEFGTATQGIYSTSLSDPGAGCHEYYVRADVGGQDVRYPETGSYGWGSCAFDDAAAEWLDGQLPPGALDPVVLTTYPWVGGSQVTLTVTGASPGTTVHFVKGTSIGAGPCPGSLGGLCLDVAGKTSKLGDDVADGSGTAELVLTAPASAVGKTVYLQGIADNGAGLQLSEVVSADIQ